jgi:hypothetical protein
VLSKQPLIPKVFYETQRSKLPAKSTFAYMPYHPVYFDTWKKLMKVCTKKMDNFSQLSDAFNYLFGESQGQKKSKAIQNYLQSLSKTNQLSTGFTEFETFWKLTLPLIQRSIICLPYNMQQCCNWGDYTVLPILGDISFVPQDFDKMPSHNPQDFISHGFSSADVVNELNRVIQAEKDILGFVNNQKDSNQGETTKDDELKKEFDEKGAEKGAIDEKTAEEVQETQSPPQINPQNQHSDSTPTQLDTGFFFGPCITKLSLPRKVVFGLLAVGFFGLPHVSVEPQHTVSFTYPHDTTVTRTFQLNCTTLDAGFVCEMYPSAASAPSSNAKLQAMLSYFSYFFENDINDNDFESNQGAILSNTFKHNVIGCVEYVWKQQGIQVDYIIDSVLDRVQINNNLISLDNYKHNIHPIPKEHLNLDGLPTSLLPISTRRGLYLTHPRLLSLDEFIDVFDRQIRTPDASNESSSLETRLYNAYNHIYSPERYPEEYKNGTINDIKNNYYKRWVYGITALEMVFLLLSTAQQIISPTFIGMAGTPQQCSLSYTNGASLQYNTMVDLLNSLKMGSNTLEDYSHQNNSQLTIDEVTTKMQQMTNIDPNTLHYEVFPHVSTTLSRLIALAEGDMSKSTLTNEPFDYLTYDDTYQGAFNASKSNNLPYHSNSPPRFRIQSFHTQFLNNSILADFANKYLGGGTYGHGAVQEEQVFSEYFECCLGMGLTVVMHKDASITMNGIINHAILGGYMARTYLSKYMTIGDNLWVQQQKVQNGPKPVTFPVTQYTNYTPKFPTSSMLAIDSTPYSNPSLQFTFPEIKRQIGKLSSGFTITASYLNHHKNGSKIDQSVTVPTNFITGNWGAGVFGATPAWVYTLQLLTTSVFDISMRYLCMGDVRCLGAHSMGLVGWYKGVTTGQIFAKVFEAVEKKQVLQDKIPNLVPFEPAIQEYKYQIVLPKTKLNAWTKTMINRIMKGFKVQRQSSQNVSTQNNDNNAIVSVIKQLENSRRDWDPIFKAFIQDINQE